MDRMDFPRLTTFLGWYLAIIGIIGILLNSIILVMFYRFRAKTSETAILLANLAFADLGIVLFGNPFSSTSNLAGRWLYGESGCQWYAFFGFFFGSAHIATLAFLALDRYNKVCKISLSNPRSLESSFNGCAVIASIWLYSFFWAFMPMIGWSRYSLEPLITSCTIDWRHNDASYKSFIIIYTIFGYVLPSMIIFLSYRAVQKWIKSRDPEYCWTNSLGDYWINQKNITFMTIVINIAFIVAWTPYAIICLYTVFGEPGDMPLWFTLLPPLMAKTSTIFNPIIYFLTNPKLRKAIWATIKCQSIELLEVESKTARSEAATGIVTTGETVTTTTSTSQNLPA